MFFVQYSLQGKFIYSYVVKVVICIVVVQILPMQVLVISRIGCCEETHR